MWHDGREFVNDSRWLAVWQRAYRERVNRRGPDPSGIYDGATQAAVVDVQKRTGQPVDGLLGPDCWAATFLYTPPKRASPPNPRGPDGRYGYLPDTVPVSKARAADLRNLKRGRQSRKSWHYWRTFSNFKVQYGTDPDAPPWWPGRVFGRFEKGWHVREVQNLLGVKETGHFNTDLHRRVLGVQKMAGLPESGIIDVPTALVIDPGPWPDEDGEDPE